MTTPTPNAAILTHAEILEALTVPGLNIEASLEPREVTLLCEAILSMQASRCTPAIESAMRNVVIEECSKVCDDYAIDCWSLYKGRAPYTGREAGRADPEVQGRSNGADVCSDRIRALKTSPNEDE